MNEYKVVVEDEQGNRWAYFYRSSSIQGAIAQCILAFPGSAFEIVAVTKKEN